ncbi:uncharacterized protein Pyn_15308 [Prunus yedoensis var. nudiflora]|uniref:non-specific serine/threonine protein kinase n=1 Tax=Prunus yedoensis var. nudiflora TaxID=2094558 RepID=A0A314XVQ6_PRUYE|nr:uncharacterized protein Pyn_15308 [Prunus yedoensis var. nudiflora]
MGTKTNTMLVFIVFLLCLFLESRISYAADTITANQSLSGDQTIVSGDFELGFFELDGRHYIGTWSKQYWTSGSWKASSKIFSLVPEMRLNYIYNYSFVSNENESYFTYSLYDPKIASPFMMSVLGTVRQLAWLEISRKWNIFWSQPRNQCEVYAICGAFGSCNDKSGVLCNCLTGFAQKSPKDWVLQDYSGGCSRKTNLQCGNSTSVIGTKDRFLEMRTILMPENELHVKVGSAKKCESICLKNCSCTAYAYESSNACSIWIGDLLGVQELAADEAGGRTLHIRLAASELMYLKNGKGDADKRSLIIAMVSAAAGTQRRKFGVSKINYGAGGGKNDTELPLFGFKSILDATNNFSEANKLGEGGFGPVYKGILPENQEVAIKRLSKKSVQGHEEFMNELNLIAKLQHTNLVRLLDPSENAELNWGKRFRIIEGIAQGVLYIHKYSRLKIIHRDLKASNVLLDAAMNPKISDFGMAKIFEINQTEANTNRVVGTYGYMSPEYARYGHFSEKLDVFSFGVLLLEIVSGKRNAAFYRFEHSPTLAGWAWELWKEGRGMEVIDASVRETCPPDEASRCIHEGFLCVQEAAADRPTMASVIRMLQGNEATSLPPSQRTCLFN